MWLHRESGLAYLPCVPPQSRAFWTPALLKLQYVGSPRRLPLPDSHVLFHRADRLSFPSEDHIALFDTNTLSVRKLRLTNLPARVQAEGLRLHGIDLFLQPDGEHATIFLNSHRVPNDRFQAPELGADSVIEIFDTTLGSDEAAYVGTVKHPLIHTPNNIVAVSSRSFYVSNDHSEKTHWVRSLVIEL